MTDKIMMPKPYELKCPFDCKHTVNTRNINGDVDIDFLANEMNKHIRYAHAEEMVLIIAKDYSDQIINKYFNEYVKVDLSFSFENFEEKERIRQLMNQDSDQS